ncbi:hypothetical protein NQ314_000039 [Rhamnusium bicolor]|uniref:ZAD domain-containing protein n=1 Tax=Rhamnusium bicolor TaxID=1586634 RepID=A0AAV8ZVT9_9CUCU|nr:hypothetical protein NQ314_000039 [Rhamnusium bicolor]
MNDINRKTCRFCLKILYSNEFCPIEETTRHMLEALLNLNLDVDNGTEMCIECARNLRNAYDFKSTCVIEKKILPLLIAKENMKLNKDSLKQNTNVELLDACEDQKICRFCLKMTERERYTILQEKEHIFILDVIQKYIPELHLSDTEEIVTCEVCLISLQSLLTFITGCLNMIEESENMDETVKSQLKLIDIKAIDSKHEVGDDNITMEENYIVKSEDVTELGNPELLIKNEETER